MSHPLTVDQPIITSLADNDLYKFTMGQAYLHHHPGVTATFLHHCRTPGIDLRTLAPLLREQIQHVSQLSFTAEELSFLASLNYLKDDFISFLRIFRPDPNHVAIEVKNDQLEIRITGPLVHITWWEIYLLSIISELHNRLTIPEPNFAEGERRLREKIQQIRQFQKEKGPDKTFRLIEFGTRRRFSKQVQERVVDILGQELSDCLSGTSNVDLARRYGLRPFGTFAHEWLQMHQATDVRLSQSQILALDIWAREYRGQLGIALTDVINMTAFLRDFDLYFAKLFDGGRHDSGNPYDWCERLITHYEKLHIDPRTKYAVFSDSLTVPKALALCDRFEGRIRTSFGIGTNLTNDLGHPALSQVIKMVECNGQAVAKISDEPGKSMCQDPAFLKYLKHVFHVDEPISAEAVADATSHPKIGGGL